jgi:hypothetical protein
LVDARSITLWFSPPDFSVCALDYAFTLVFLL